jgi:hypothetical protein
MPEDVEGDNLCNVLPETSVDSVCNDEGLKLLSFFSSLNYLNCFSKNQEGKVLGTFFPGDVLLDYFLVNFRADFESLRILEPSLRQMPPPQLHI